MADRAARSPLYDQPSTRPGHLSFTTPVFPKPMSEYWNYFPERSGQVGQLASQVERTVAGEPYGRIGSAFERATIAKQGTAADGSHGTSQERA